MDFVANQETQIQEMLTKIGVSDILDLFESVPKEIQVPRPAEDDGVSEFEGMRLMESLAAKNRFPEFDHYLGGGAYEHHVPALVGAICGKSEFLTAYTPYQAEVSQGLLQSIFEFQSAICSLTGLDVANASLYDGASACAEGVLMALRCQKKRKRVLIGESLHPHYREVVEQYLNSQDVTIETYPNASLDEEVAALLLPYPNFFGIVEDYRPLIQEAKALGIKTVVCANPLVYGVYASADELGADIAVGDCQPLGLPLQFGGPYVGYIACKQELMRQIPGRVVGETKDTEGRTGYVLTLQAREQHIRREKATSNICSNQALAALASLVTILWYGREGIQKLALTNFQRASYLKSQLVQIPGVSAYSDAPHFNEFVVKFDKPIEEVLKRFREKKIEPGIPLEMFFPDMKNHLLVCVTETKSKEQLDRYCEVLR